MASPVWFDRMITDVRRTSASEEVAQYLERTRNRIIYTTEYLRSIGVAGKKVCEVGPGGIGLACARELGAQVEAWDYSDWFKPICDDNDIAWGFADLNQTLPEGKGPYDIILLCEVIEHISRWPVDVLSELRGWLCDGGSLLVTTQNLHRTSNRLRMIAGKRLFANFVPEELIMAHVREYTPEELDFLLRRAGFTDIRSWLTPIPGVRHSRLAQAGYEFLCKLQPRQSNFIFCWATNNAGQTGNTLQ